MKQQGLKLSFNQIANLIKLETQDVSGGSFADGSLMVRTIGEKRLVETFKKLELKNSSSGGRITLEDIAEIKSSVEKGSILKFVDGNPAVELWVRRSKTSDALVISENVEKVISNAKNIIGNVIKVETYNTAANLLKKEFLY